MLQWHAGLHNRLREGAALIITSTPRTLFRTPYLRPMQTLRSSSKQTVVGLNHTPKTLAEGLEGRHHGVLSDGVWDQVLVGWGGGEAAAFRTQTPEHESHSS